MRRPDLLRLRFAPELPLLSALDATLAAARASLLSQHPTLADLEPIEPASVAAARSLLGAIDDLRRALQRYRRVAYPGPPRRPRRSPSEPF